MVLFYLVIRLIVNIEAQTKNRPLRLSVEPQAEQLAIFSPASGN